MSAQPVLMGFFAVSFQHWLMGTFSYTSLRTASPPHAPSESRLDPPSSFDIVPVLSLLERIQLLHCVSAFTPLTASLQYLGNQVDGPGLCSARQVHNGRCVAYVANVLPKTLADLGVQILSRFGSLDPSGNMRALCEEANSSSVSPVSCVTKRTNRK